MIRSAKVLFCDNEHGAGDVTFPLLADLDERSFVEPMNIRQLRAEAKKAGWKYKSKRDWCDACAEDI